MMRRRRRRTRSPARRARRTASPSLMQKTPPRTLRTRPRTSQPPQGRRPLRARLPWRARPRRRRHPGRGRPERRRPGTTRARRRSRRRSRPCFPGISDFRHTVWLSTSRSSRPPPSPASSLANRRPQRTWDRRFVSGGHVLRSPWPNPGSRRQPVGLRHTDCDFDREETLPDRRQQLGNLGRWQPSSESTARSHS
ncbi:hypothetical protein DFJ74DRAFT_102711 [Hyaloraphidium curvatum]|nr:hypothetical protein DFJ74DRAFT_102711 [Hyaloraphidium curvatum]